MAHHHPLFQAISGDLARGYLALSAFLHTKNRKGEMLEHRFFPAKQTRQAEKWALEKSQAGADVYVRTTTLRKPPSQGRGKKTLTLETNCLWVDIDKPPSKCLPTLKAFTPRPSLIIGSGNGVHAYWILSEPITDIDSIEAKNRWLQDQLNGDNCGDAAHILRVPGTQNYKDRDNPKPVEILDTHPQTYDPDDFKETNRSSSVAQFPSQLQEEPLPEDFLDLLTPSIAKLITTGEGAKTDAKGRINRSSRDYKVANVLLESGWSPGQILSAFTNTAWSLSAKVQETGGLEYAIRTILSAQQNQVEKTPTPLALVDTSQRTIQDEILDIISRIDEDGTRKYRRFVYSADLYEPVIKILVDHGNRFFVDTETHSKYLISSEGESVTVSADPTSAFSRWLTRHSGLTPNTGYHTTIRQGIDAVFSDIATQARVIPWCYFYEDRRTLYVTLDQSGRQLLRVNEREIVQIVNGADKVIAVTSNVEPLEWQPDVDVVEAFEDFLEVMPRAVATSTTGRQIFLAYVLALPFFAGFRRRLGTLPILHLRGPAGEGKTETLRWLVTLIYGTPEELGESTIAATYRIAFKQMFLAFDDYDKMDQDQKQFFLAAATGVKRTMSKRGDDEGTVEKKVHIPMAVTRIAEFEEEALRRRTFQLEISQRLHPDSTFDEGRDHSFKIAKLRSRFWSALLVWSQTVIDPVIDGLADHTKVFSKAITSAPHQPLGASLALMYLLLREFYKEMGDELDLEETAKAWIQELKLFEEDFREKDPLLQGISMVFESVDTLLGATAITKNGVNGTDRPTIIQQLFKQRDIRLNPADDHVQGLYGTTTAWTQDLRKASDRTMKYSPQGFTAALKSLVGRFGLTIELGRPVEIPGYRLTWRDLGQCRGWEITRIPRSSKTDSK